MHKIEHTLIFLNNNETLKKETFSLEELVNLFYILDFESMERTTVPFFKHTYIKTEFGVDIKDITSINKRNEDFDAKYFSKSNIELLETYKIITKKQVNDFFKTNKQFQTIPVGNEIRHEDMSTTQEKRDFLKSRREDTESFSRNYKIFKDLKI